MILLFSASFSDSNSHLSLLHSCVGTQFAIIAIIASEFAFRFCFCLFSIQYSVFLCINFILINFL